MKHPGLPQRAQHGFTLIEMIMVILILGVIGGMVAVFMRGPIDAYLAGARRAALTDEADTVVRRMARDIRKSLPNSIGTSADKKCIEFIPTKTGGRYRTADLVPGDGTSLVFGSPDATFNMFGSNAALPADQRIVAQPGEYDVIAVSNFGYGIADAYAGNNTAVVSSVVDGAESTINIASTTFNVALASPNNRFQVIPAKEKVVAYVCSGTYLYRLSSTSLGHICPATPASTDPIMARNVTYAACSFDYSGSDLQRNALVSMKIELSDSGEAVSLQHEVHVNNTP